MISNPRYRAVLIDFNQRRALVLRRRPGRKVCAVIRWVGFSDRRMYEARRIEPCWF